MRRFRFFQPYLLKVSFFLSLLVILYLLISFVFFSPDNVALANLAQKVNIFFSWPYIMLESLTHFSMHWVLTALWILIFWFCFFYLILSLFAFLRQD